MDAGVCLDGFDNQTLLESRKKAQSHASRNAAREASQSPVNALLVRFFCGILLWL